MLSYRNTTRRHNPEDLDFIFTAVKASTVSNISWNLLPHTSVPWLTWLSLQATEKKEWKEINFIYTVFQRLFVVLGCLS
jgi:hypothetical protein